MGSRAHTASEFAPPRYGWPPTQSRAWRRGGRQIRRQLAARWPRLAPASGGATSTAGVRKAVQGRSCQRWRCRPARQVSPPYGLIQGVEAWRAADPPGSWRLDGSGSLPPAGSVPGGATSTAGARFRFYYLQRWPIHIRPLANHPVFSPVKGPNTYQLL